MFYTKEHLFAGAYEWTGLDGPTLFTGTPSRRTFDRYNGPQVLFIINYFGESVGKTTIADGRRTEELISMSLPLGVKSELSVMRWLKEC